MDAKSPGRITHQQDWGTKLEANGCGRARCATSYRFNRAESLRQFCRGLRKVAVQVGDFVVGATYRMAQPHCLAAARRRDTANAPMVLLPASCRSLVNFGYGHNAAIVAPHRNREAGRELRPARTGKQPLQAAELPLA